MAVRRVLRAVLAVVVVLSVVTWPGGRRAEAQIEFPKLELPKIGAPSIGGKKLKLPTIEDIRREAGNLSKDAKREVGNCLSGGCDPALVVPGFDWSSEAVGLLGAKLFTEAAGIMYVRHRGRTVQTLTPNQKSWLRPFYGKLVDEVRVIYNARLMDYLGSFGGKTIRWDSEAQTYGAWIYVNAAQDVSSVDQAVLLGHELAHSAQWNVNGRSLADFGYFYFYSWAKNGFKYSQNGMEDEANRAESSVMRAMKAIYFRNQTSAAMWVATGFPDQKTGQWLASGWFEVKPGENRALILPYADGGVSRYNYFYAWAGDLVWSGSSNFWVHPRSKFEQVDQGLGPTDARNKGYELRLFREVDRNNLTRGEYPYQVDLSAGNADLRPTTSGATQTGPTPVPAKNPTEEAAGRIVAAARSGDVLRARQMFEEAEGMMALQLPARTFAEVCWQGALQGQAGAVMYACDEAARRAPDDPDVHDKRGLARGVSGNLAGALEDFRFAVQKLEPQLVADGRMATREASARVAIRKIWIQQLAANVSPFTPAIIADLRAAESEQPWMSDPSGRPLPSGDARPRAPYQSAAPAQAAPQTGGGGDGTASAPSAGAVVLDFEKKTAWRRGDQPYGDLTTSSAQVAGGKSAAQVRYDFPAVAGNYVVFLAKPPVAIPGRPAGLTAMVYGDGSGHFLNAWIQDATGEVRQYTFGRINHTGWQQMTAAFNDAGGWPNSHISGKDNGQTDFPAKLFALVLDGVPDGQASTGEVFVDDVRAGGQ